MVGEITRDITQTDGGGDREPPEIRFRGSNDDDEVYHTQQEHDDAAFEAIRLRMAEEAVGLSPVGMHFGTLTVDHQLRVQRAAGVAASLALSIEEVNSRFMTMTKGVNEDITWSTLN